MSTPDPSIDDLALRYGFSFAQAEDEIVAVYRMAQYYILDSVERAIVARPDRDPTQLIRLLSNVSRRYEQALTKSGRLVASNSLEAFNAGAQGAERSLTQQRVRVETSWAHVNRRAVQESMREQMSDLLRATRYTEERVKERVRAITLDETRRMAATGMRAKEASRVVAERLADEGVFGVQARNGRYIPMDEYARVVTHTKLREVHTKGTEALITENGHDLVRVTTHLHRPDNCTPLEGKVYSISGQTPGYPPLVHHTPFHPGCFVGETRVLPVGDVERAFRRPYNGDVLDVWTADSGSVVFTVTPNHPVLTDRGWVGAGELHEGDHLIRLTFGNVVSEDHYVADPDASLREIFEAAQQCGLVERVAGSTVDFHGDGLAEQVDVVTTNAYLVETREATLSQHQAEIILASADYTSTKVHRCGNLATGSLSSSASGDVTTLVGRSRSHPQLHGLRLTPDGHVVRAEDVEDSALLESEASANGFSRNAALIKADDLVRYVGVSRERSGGDAISDTASLDASRVEGGKHGSITDMESLRDRADSVTFGVQTTQVIRVERRRFEGHVYNLQTESGFYMVAGIPVKNCRHAEAPFVETFRSEAELDRVRAESSQAGPITVYSAADIARIDEQAKKRQQFMRVKRDLRKRDEVSMAAGDKAPPKDPKAYERSLTARANAKVRALNAKRD